MFLRTLLWLLLSFGLSGCASFDAYERVSGRVWDADRLAKGQEIRVVRGRPNRAIDGLGRIFAIPSRLALGDQRADNHDVSVETESELLDYMYANGLESVLVRVNQYDPRDEFKRTVSNSRIRPFWRLTAGGYNLLKYTFAPGRITGGDWYNPYSNTLNIYSDIPEITIAQASYATELRNRLNAGAYSALQELPLFNIMPGKMATTDALQYYKQHRPERVEQAQQLLYPNYGASVGSQIGSFLPYGNLIGKVVGGLSGRAANSLRR